QRIGDTGLLDRRLDGARHLVLVEHGVAGPEPDDTRQQAEDGDPPEDRGCDRANPFHATASLFRRSSRHAAIAGVLMSLAPRVARYRSYNAINSESSRTTNSVLRLGASRRGESSESANTMPRLITSVPRNAVNVVCHAWPRW